jgi:hypothetical protein
MKILTLIQIRLQILIVLIFLNTYSICKCIFQIPLVGYTSSIYKFIKCFPEYKEIYSETNNPKMIGEPVGIETKPILEDVKFQFTKEIGHLVIEEVTDDHFSFVTNQHLIFFDIYWVITLLVILLISGDIFARIIDSSTLNLFKIFPNTVNTLIFLVLHVFYLSPLFGMSPTSFKTLDPYLGNCWIKDEPEFGIEFSWRGLIQLEHFTLKNDWIRITCPTSIYHEFIFNKKDFIKTKTNSTPKSLGILHKADQSWWDNRRMDYSLIKKYDEEKSKAHFEVFKKNRLTCVDKNCCWGNTNSEITETDYYFVLNSTLLPGHSGLSCRESYDEKKFHGIVQGYHHGHGFNICSKLSKGQWSLQWIIFPFFPLIMMLLVYLHMHSKWIFKNFSFNLVILLVLIGIINQDTYY